MKRLLPLTAALGLAACVTINIYFPAAAAEKVADRIIDEVWQMQKDGAPRPNAPHAPAAAPSAPEKENK